MSTKHTPGDWVEDPIGWIVSKSHGPIAQVDQRSRYFGANADLLCSAPMLLEACEASNEVFARLVEVVRTQAADTNPETARALEEIHTALCTIIGVAKGETPA